MGKINHRKDIGFSSRQRVMVKTRAEVNRKLATGLKFGTIYHIKEVTTCPDCGNEMLTLYGTFDPNVTSRICPCGKDGFDPNAFNSERFATVNLRIKYRNTVLV